MDRKFILSCGSTVDLPYDYCQHREIPVIFYTYVLDGVEREDDMERNPGMLEKFYQAMREGAIPQTSQINTERYIDFFTEQLKHGDVLHIAFGSGMSASVNNAMNAARELDGKIDGHRMMVVDSLCSCGGYGLLVDLVADLRDQGMGIEEAADWAVKNCGRIHHQFFSTDLTYFRRSGRMSGATATIATILNICPIMRLNDEGRIIAYDKVRGRANAVKETIRVMRNHVQDGVNYSGKCLICHSDDPVDGERARAEICAEFPKADVHLLKIGTIIGAHCGPGTVAVFFLGDQRTHEDPK